MGMLDRIIKFVRRDNSKSIRTDSDTRSYSEDIQQDKSALESFIFNYFSSRSKPDVNYENSGDLSGLCDRLSYDIAGFNDSGEPFTVSIVDDRTGSIHNLYTKKISNILKRTILVRSIETIVRTAAIEGVCRLYLPDVDNRVVKPRILFGETFGYSVKLVTDNDGKRFYVQSKNGSIVNIVNETRVLSFTIKDLGDGDGIPIGQSVGDDLTNLKLAKKSMSMARSESTIQKILKFPSWSPSEIRSFINNLRDKIRSRFNEYTKGSGTGGTEGVIGTQNGADFIDPRLNALSNTADIDTATRSILASANIPNAIIPGRGGDVPKAVADIQVDYYFYGVVSTMRRKYYYVVEEYVRFLMRSVFGLNPVNYSVHIEWHGKPAQIRELELAEKKFDLRAMIHLKREFAISTAEYAHRLGFKPSDKDAIRQEIEFKREMLELQELEDTGTNGIPKR